MQYTVASFAIMLIFVSKI